MCACECHLSKRWMQTQWEDECATSSQKLGRLVLYQVSRQWSCWLKSVESFEGVVPAWVSHCAHFAQTRDLHLVSAPSCSGRGKKGPATRTRLGQEAKANSAKKLGSVEDPGVRHGAREPKTQTSAPNRTPGRKVRVHQTTKDFTQSPQVQSRIGYGTAVAVAVIRAAAGLLHCAVLICRETDYTSPTSSLTSILKRLLTFSNCSLWKHETSTCAQL